MSAEHDKRRQIKLTPENESILVETQKSMPIAVTLSALANRAIELGAPELLAPTKPSTKKGK